MCVIVIIIIIIIISLISIMHMCICVNWPPVSERPTNPFPFGRQRAVQPLTKW